MAEMMRAVQVQGDGALVLGEAMRPVPGQGEVLIEVRAAGLNRADLLQRKGLYPPPPGASEIMGLECAGIIAAIGPGVQDWAVGDRVCALLAGGGYGDYVAVDMGSLLSIPDVMSFEHAACFPEAMITVWANVYDRCRLRPGEAFLVHGGTSGIGVMAIQMARVHGASAIYTTAGTPEKCALATRLGASQAINYREGDFQEVISASGGVDVVLDMVGGAYVQKNIDIARIDGRIVNIAYQDGFSTEVNFLPVMLKRLMVTATTLRARPNPEKARLRAGMEHAFWGAVTSGAIQPVLDSTFPMTEADAAHMRMASGAHSGKIILTR